MVGKDDWRLIGQEDYLIGTTLFYKNYVDRKTTTDHDHCELCFIKFSNNYSGTLQAGYTTANDYRWICPPCFGDFKDMLQFKVRNVNEQGI